MADRAKPKRFKACKIRVHTQSTRGRKTTRNIRVTSATYHRPERTAVGSLTNSEEGNSKCIDDFVFDDNNSNEKLDIEETKSGEQGGLSKYHQRRVKEFSHWEAVRESLVKARIEEEAFPIQTCVTCAQPAVCRCVDCGPRQFFCMDCGKVLHSERNYFHILEIYKDGCFVPLMANHSVLSMSHQKSFPSSQCRTIICIDQFGHQHKKSILFCNCEDDAVTLIKLQLWPGSVTRTSVAFHFKLMMLAEQFLLECHVSLQKFCDVLDLNKSSMLPKWIQSLYRVLNSDSYDEFRYHQSSFKSLKPYFGNISNECPLCPQNGSGGVLIESMDGCFGLVRKKSAGMNLCPPRHGSTFFADQDDVDNFVNAYGKKAKDAPTDCNEFKSGEVNNMLRSKGRNKLFDEKGVFGRVCRHEHPKGFISIKHGERIAYSVYEVERLLNDCDDKTDVKIMYDIGCTLSAHLKKNDRQDILKRTDLAIPVFHCYGHKSRCQIAFGPRRKKGYGLTDGEGIERLWSYLRGFSSMTKEMTAGRRVDILTDALIHYAERRLEHFGPSLVKKVSKTKNLMEHAMSQLQEIFSKLTGGQEIPCSMYLDRAELLPLFDEKSSYDFANGNFSHLELRNYRGIAVAVREYEVSIIGEVKTVLNLPSHPCLPVLIGVCTESKPFLLVTKFYGTVSKGVFLSVSGALTSDRINNVQWTSIVLDIAEGLCHMHYNGFIHGELTVENIVLYRQSGRSRALRPVFLNLEKGKPADKKDVMASYHYDITMFGGLVDTITTAHSVKTSTSFLGLCAVSQFIKDTPSDGNINTVTMYIKNLLSK